MNYQGQSRICRPPVVLMQPCVHIRIRTFPGQNANTPVRRAMAMCAAGRLVCASVHLACTTARTRRSLVYYAIWRAMMF